MSIDLILWAKTKADFATFALAHKLFTRDGDPAKGVEHVWWQESGKFTIKAATYDADGNQLTPPTYAPGLVMLLKLHHGFFDNDKMTPDEAAPEKAEQWARSKVVLYIKNNGTSGTMGSIPYYEVDNVRIFRPQDIRTFLASKGLPGHVWAGGMSD